MSNLNEIQLSERYEAGWTPSNCGLPSVLTFLSHHVNRPYDADLVCSLIEIDLERSWLAWKKHAEGLAVKGDLEQLLKNLNELSRLTGYRSLLEEVHATKPYYQQLVFKEYEVRNQSGDMIGPAYYQSYFAETVPEECGTAVRRVYSVDGSLSCTALTKGAPLRSLNLLGRRRSADDRNLQVEYKPEGNRIIVAPIEERRVSRIQVSLQVLTPKYACLRNEGTVNAFVLTPGEAIQPGEARIVAFPFEVRLPNIALSFR